jgi:uncharacterized protein (DUF362 family)
MPARRKPQRERDPRPMSRRQFLWTGLAAGGLFVGWRYLEDVTTWRPREFKPSRLNPRLAVAKDTDAFAATRRALAKLGGLEQLVSPGDRVLVKPNISWAYAPKFANNTNPEVVAAVVQAALAAGAGAVGVVDFPMRGNPAQETYAQSGIAAAVARVSPDGRARMVYVNEARDFVRLSIPGGVSVREWGFYRPALECDVLINVPVLKHHGQSGLTIGLKALFGVAADPRGDLHQDIHRRIVDLNRVIRTDLTVLDATRVLMRGGPAGRLLHQVKRFNTVVAGTDRVAVDAYGAFIFGLKPEKVGFIREADGALEIPGGGRGQMDYTKVGLLTE